MTDDLESRLRAADPTKSTDPNQATPSWISSLVEATMNESLTPQRRRWQVPAAAAAVLVLGVGGYAVAQGEGTTSQQPSASAQPMKLSTAKPGIGMSACIRFTVGTLAKVPVAFSGTVASSGKSGVLVNVDHWYHGGGPLQVKISTPDPSQISVEGAVTFTAGQRYLVAATDGIVNGCGYTAQWNPAMAAAFGKAFK